jgi:glycosyltransferase involved in cell wall biosynthesis
MTISGNPKGKFFLQKMLTRLSSRKAKKVIFVSQYARNTIADQLGIPFEKSEVVYHGLNHELFSPDRRFETLSRAFREKIDALAPYVLCVSTLYPHKNYDTLLKAWAQLPDKIRHRYKLVIAGMCADFAHCEYLFNLTDHLSIADEVVFLGRVLYHNIPYLYAQASTFVLPSYLETFGHPLVEAMAMRVPIVASKSTCIPEIVADAAILFDASNSRELAKKLESVILDQQIRRSLVARGRQRASSFSWGQTARKTLRLIERVAER